MVNFKLKYTNPAHLHPWLLQAKVVAPRNNTTFLNIWSVEDEDQEEEIELYKTKKPPPPTGGA